MEINTVEIQTCKSCGHVGTGKYCSACGQNFKTNHISLPGLLHDVFHFFTHLERGFGYTLKQLIVAPGAMEREYVDGIRSRHQKPFSMFFICTSINALGRYWMYEIVIKYYHSGDVSEASFFHQYMVLLYVLLMPLIALLTWLFFWKSKYNYAEVGVLQLYNFSFIFLALTFIPMFKFIWPTMDTAKIDLPILIIYSVITFINFFKASNKWLTLVKCIILMIIVFAGIQQMEDLVIKIIK